ncbi:MAG: hypothetical protein AAF927_01730 [Bacteroidota bacterium]
MPLYKFRAESKADLESLLEIAGENSIGIDVINQYQIEDDTPDIVVRIETDLKIRVLRFLMSMVADGHVMYQTVREPELYTGNRDYDIKIQ